MNIKELKNSRYITVPEMVYRNARNYPNKEAVVFKDKRLTYRDIDVLSNQVANFLIGLGVQKGDRVAMMMLNSEKFPAVYFGILKAGGVAINLNTAFTKPEVSFILNNSGARVFIFGENFAKVLDNIQKEVDTVEKFVCVGENSLEGTLNFFDLMKNSPGERPPVDIDENDLCSIIYTSGTTGTPRGAVFNHRAVITNARDIGALNHRYHHFTRNLIMMPLFHSAPLHNHFLATCYVGGTAVILDAFDPKLFLETIQGEKITAFFGPAVVYLTCAKLFDLNQYDLSSVQLFSMGGSPSSKADQDMITEAFKLEGRLLQVYGLTEAGPVGCGLWPEYSSIKQGALGNAGSLGCEIAIVDENFNKIEEPGVVGEIAVYSDCHMLGYYNDPEKTAATLLNGWIMTGDLAKYDEDGFLYFVDRSKDMLCPGGQNVYSKEVEDVVMLHPAVMEAAVIGANHPEWGESVKAVVSLRPGTFATPEDIIDFCQDKLAKFKRPRYVQIIEAIPHNPAGKIVKPEIRKLYGKPESQGLS